MLYTAIYYLNKVMPRLAKRLADRYFPLYEHETPHDLDDREWDEALFADDLDLDYPDRDEYWNSIVNGDYYCTACEEPERYDDHFCLARS